MAASIRGTAVTAAIAVVASLGLLLPGTATVAAGAEQGRLSVAPDRGPAGSHVQVDGAGFADDRAVAIQWEPTGERLGTATGPEFSTTVSIPGDATEGSHAIGAHGQPRETGAGDARHATAPFTVTAADEPDDVVAGEDEAAADQPDDDGDSAESEDESGESDADGDAGDDGEDPSGGSDGSEAGDDESEPSEEPQSTEDGGSGGTDGGSGDGESSSGTSGDGAPQRTDMSPNPDDDASAESDGQEADGQESDGQESDGQESNAQESDSDERDPDSDPDESESSDAAEASSGEAETATAAPGESDDEGASATDEDPSSATTYRKSSSGPPAPVSHEVGEVQPSAVEEPPEVDFAAVLDSEAFQAQEAPAPEVAADSRAQPDAAGRERLATAGGSRTRQVPAATEPSTPQGAPAAVGTQAAPNSEEVSLLVLLAASGALLVWHRRRQPLLRRR